MLARFVLEEDGNNAIEYGVIGALFVVVLISSLSLIGTVLRNTFVAWASSM